MTRKTLIWLAVAGILILIGCILFGGAMSVLRWDFSKLATVKYETNTHEITQNFQRIAMETDTADIEFVSFDEENYKVVCQERTNGKHTVTVEDGTLTVKLMDQRTWRDYIGINIGKPKITLYIPRNQTADLLIQGPGGSVLRQFLDIRISVDTGDVTFDSVSAESVRVKTSTGHIRLENLHATALELSVSTGKVELTDISCGNLTSTGNTGSMLLKNVTAAEKISIERSTGNVKFDGCDAAQIFVTTDTGSVTGSLLTDKIFIAQTSTGKINVPETTTGGQCRISTDTGDILLTIAE